jgi:hypothetical protein
MLGPKAPKDPQAKRKGFYVLLDQQVGGLPQDDGVNRYPIFLGDGRLVTFAKMVGGIQDETMLELLTTEDGFRKLVHSLGVSIVTPSRQDTARLIFSFKRRDCLPGASCHTFAIPGNGAEQQIVLDELDWVGVSGDCIPGAFTVELPGKEDVASVTIKLYLNDGFDAPENDPDPPVEVGSRSYERMIARSFLSGGNNYRLKQVLARARAGEPINIAFLGGSITQGAGGIPIQSQCYARKTFQGLQQRCGAGNNLRYIKAGVGGTPSETGLMRYARDIDRYGTTPPDLVVLEFAVNDSADELEGGCYESLVKMILDQPQKPALILLFAVFANDWNLKDRLAPIGYRYQLPMVDLQEAVVQEFTKPAGARVLSKRQYFYDQYHPSNMGHTIMADALLYLIDRLDGQAPLPEWNEDVPPQYTTAFSTVRLIDRQDHWAGATITPGCFSAVDDDLQSVPFDDRPDNTPEFPYNWSRQPGAQAGRDPFVVELCCKGLMLVFKDSAREDFGRAQVWIDGTLNRVLDPREAGWTHCNTTILLNETCCRPHRVEVRMADGDEDKAFTILGIGYVTE